VTSAPAIEARGLRKAFGKTQALDGLDLQVAAGEILGLLGPNGAGKTTTVRVLTTLLRPDRGSATVAGHDVVADAGKVRRVIGLTGQYAALDESLTGRANLVMVGQLGRLSLRQARTRAAELLEQFELTDAADRGVKTYSGGMRRRLDLAASLVTRPQVLFLDEPTTGLDPGSRIVTWDAVRSLAAELYNVELEVTSNHATATEKLAANVAAGRAAQPDLVIWPENSTDIDPTQDPTVYDEIAGAAAAIGRPILVGAVLQNPLRNAGVLWLPHQGPTTIYAKRRLVPFGEYVPFRSLISKITSLTALQPTDFTPGHQTVVFNVGQIKLGDVICYEVGFDDLVRSEVQAGANLLSVQSNDATFEREGPTTAESGQQLAMARIRAVEFDRSVVVASTTGYSAIVAPDGRLISRSGTWTQAELEARVPLLTYTTLAERLGAWPEWAIVAATSLALCVAIGQASTARRRRTRLDKATARSVPAE